MTGASSPPMATSSSSLEVRTTVPDISTLDLTSNDPLSPSTSVHPSSFAAKGLRQRLGLVEDDYKMTTYGDGPSDVINDDTPLISRRGDVRTYGWLGLAIASGTCAAFNGAFAKL